MLVEKIEHKWLAAFVRTFTLCKVQPGEVVAILAETQSRRVNVDLARLALESLGAKVFEVTLTSPALTAPAPVRSTGASDAIGQLGPVVAALARVDMVVDCTVEGLLHAPELPTIMKGVDGHMPRLLMVSNEHPEILERTVPDPALEGVVRAAMKKLRGAQFMHVSSSAGTDLRIGLNKAVVGGVWGFCPKPGMVSHWPAGLALARQLGLSAAETRAAGFAGLMHDLGKADVPLEVLNKAGRLTEAEFAQVRLHPEHGHRRLLAAGVDDPVALGFVGLGQEIDQRQPVKCRRLPRFH